MLKRKIDKYLENWLNERKTTLLIKGARQIGKTFSVVEFARKNFTHFININFAERTDLIDMFAQLRNSEQLIVNLSTIDGQNMVEGETLIFFDEIQLLYQRRDDLKNAGKLDLNSQDIITAMKTISILGKYRVILSGSLLGTEVKDIVLSPLGYQDEYQMFPLDFEEFLWAKGVGEESISYVRKCFEDKQEVPDSINQMYLNYFREYVLIGGMPEAVTAYIETLNLHKVQLSQEQITSKYTYDITTYIKDEAKKLRVRDIFNSMPAELNSKNKRFVSTHVVEPSFLKRNSLLDEFVWLTNAGVAIPVYNVTEPIIPLALSAERKTLKLFVCDTGLLTSMLVPSGVREKLLTNQMLINYGAPYENVVAQELYAHGYDSKLFYYNSKKHGEVDFVVQYNDEVLPIEIKSGKPNDMLVYNHSALNNLISLYDIKTAFVFGECNVKKETNVIWQLPIYMISFIEV